MSTGKFRLIAAIAFALVLLVTYLVMASNDTSSKPAQQNSNDPYVIH